MTVEVDATVSKIELVGAGSSFVVNVATGSGGGGVSDHGALTGLDADDHKQYETVGWFTATDTDFTFTTPGMLYVAAYASDVTVTLPPVTGNAGRHIMIIATPGVGRTVTVQAQPGDWLQSEPGTGPFFTGPVTFAKIWRFVAVDVGVTGWVFDPVPASHTVTAVDKFSGLLAGAETVQQALEIVDASAGSGDVTGPVSSTDGHAAVFDGATGKVIRDAGAEPVLEGDSRLSDARTPTAHKSSHATGGSDELAPSDIGAAAASHTHSASDTTSGTFDVARIPNLDASKITSGTVATARLGSGTASSSTFLRGDQTWATVSGGSTAPAFPVENCGPVRPGEYILLSDAYAPGQNANQTPGSTALNSNAFLTWFPVRFHEQFTFDRMACRVVTTNDGTSAAVRLGVYADDDGRPGDLLLDAGSASINTPGVKILTHTATTLDPGVWWFALVCNGLDIDGTNPTFSALTNYQRSTGSIVAPQDSNIAYRPQSQRANVTGALPNPAGSSIKYTAGATIWHIYLRRQP